jgi:hypothetical protein
LLFRHLPPVHRVQPTYNLVGDNEIRPAKWFFCQPCSNVRATCRQPERLGPEERPRNCGRPRIIEGSTMDELRFDNIARRLGGLRSRRGALKTAGCGAAALFTAFRLEKSAFSQVTIENHCIARELSCEEKKKCCSFSRKRRKEIVCKLSNAGTGNRCCGQDRASCFDHDDCCLNYECNIGNECSLNTLVGARRRTACAEAAS